MTRKFGLFVIVIERILCSPSANIVRVSAEHTLLTLIQFRETGRMNKH